MAEQDKNDIVSALTQSNPSRRVRPLYGWLAAAAAVVLVVVVVLMMQPPSPSQRPIEIPPELAQMTVEQLLELNRDPSASAFEPAVIEAALRAALDRLPPADVIRIARNAVRTATAGARRMSMEMDAQRAAPPAQPVSGMAGMSGRPFSETVEDSNLFVRARLAGITLDVEAIREALIREEMFGRMEDFLNNYRVTLQLDVVDALPAGSIADGTSLTVPVVLNENQLNGLEEGAEYYFAMTDRAGEPRFLPYFSGVFPVEASHPAQAELWPFFADAQDILLFGNTPSQDTIDYWADRMQGETCMLALEYMSLLPNELLPAGALMDAIAQMYANEITGDEPSTASPIGGNGPLFLKAIALLVRAGDKARIQDMLDLFDEDIALADESVLWRTIRGRNNLMPDPEGLLALVIRMHVATAQGNIADAMMAAYTKYRDTPLVLQTWEQRDTQGQQDRFAQWMLDEIIRQAATIDDEDVTAMLWDIFARPADFGITDVDAMARLWTILGVRDGAAIRTYLEEFLADPNPDSLGVAPGPDFLDVPFRCEQSAFEVLRSLRGPAQLTHEEVIAWLVLIHERHKGTNNPTYFVVNTLQEILKPTDTVCIPVVTDLLLMDVPHWAIAQIIAQRMPNPALVDPIYAAFEKGTFGGPELASLIGALYACGQEDEAITKAIDLLAEPLDRQDGGALRGQVSRNAAMVQFLGTTSRPELLPLIEEYTTSEFSATWNQIATDLGDSRMRFSLDDLRQNAIVALARLGGRSSIKSLRRLNESSDVRVRMVSGLALCYLGDNAGDLVGHYVDGSHRLLAEVAIRWHVDLAGGAAFQSVISSNLRNERTDELWLAKMTHSLDRADIDVKTDFFRDHRAEILAIAVGHLNHPSRETRGFAAEILRNATARNFGFNPNQYPHQQDNIVQRWQDYLATAM